MNHWFNTSADPPTTPQPPDDPPTVERLIARKTSQEADYEWLVFYLTSVMRVDERVFRATIPTIQRSFVDDALADDFSDIQLLSSKLDTTINDAKAPELKLNISGEVMYHGRDRHWKDDKGATKKWPSHKKIEELQAARREIAWLKLERFNLDKEVRSRQATLGAGRLVAQRPYVPGQRQSA